MKIIFSFQRFNRSLCIVFLCISLFSCNENKDLKRELDQNSIDTLLSNQYNKILKYEVDSSAFPRSYSHKESLIKEVPSKDWTSGFFAGNLWQLYRLTGNTQFKDKAEQWTAYIAKERLNSTTHDMGFKVFNSFGNGLKAGKNNEYDSIIVESASTLSTRFNKNIGSIRSWDFNRDIWQFPVIIDNMMNLELLFEATKITGDSSYYELANIHAKTTLKNHFRTDNSCYHVVDYDTITYEPRMKVTHQGISNESSWARGQAWAIYGFTMAYRYTNNPDFLERAKATSSFFLNDENLPDDGIPYWDFDDPKIPDAPRDVSAATIVSSAFVELFRYTRDSIYLNHSRKVINNLKSEAYIISDSLDAPFILDHSTGNYPKDDEIDEPLVYADYYFLEAILRLNNL